MHERLQNAIAVPVELYDERFTTRLAQRDGGRADEDSRAAAHLLSDWLRHARRWRGVTERERSAAEREAARLERERRRAAGADGYEDTPFAADPAHGGYDGDEGDLEPAEMPLGTRRVAHSERPAARPSRAHARGRRPTRAVRARPKARGLRRWIGRIVALAVLGRLRGRDLLRGLGLSALPGQGRTGT